MINQIVLDPLKERQLVSVEGNYSIYLFLILFTSLQV